MNWMVTFEKFNIYYLVQSIISFVAIVACLISRSECKEEFMRKMLLKAVAWLIIYHAILTPLYLLNPVK